jgi:hypothetical protein
MPAYVLVWDLETVPDFGAMARVHGGDEADEAAAPGTTSGISSPSCPSIGSPASEH